MDEYPEDDLYPRAVEVCMVNDTMTISRLQRHLMIGYNRTARLLERMADKGVLTHDNITGVWRRAPSASAEGK